MSFKAFDGAVTKCWESKKSSVLSKIKSKKRSTKIQLLAESYINLIF